MKEFPHQMSGGMRQRIVGAIAQAGGPQIIIADEPTTNLDVTIQLQYLNLLKDLQRASGVALIFVTHNLGIVAKMCDKVAVMYAGRIVEMQSVRGLFYHPRHPYTRALLDSIPKLGTKEPLYAIPGQPPDLSDLPTGCSFHPRCAARWSAVGPRSRGSSDLGDGETVRCWLADRRGCAWVSRLLEVRDLKKHFRGRRLPAGQGAGLGQGGRRHQLHHRQRRDAGPGGGVRLRQDDHLEADPGRRGAHGWRHRVRGAEYRRASTARS